MGGNFGEGFAEPLKFGTGAGEFFGIGILFGHTQEQFLPGESGEDAAEGAFAPALRGGGHVVEAQENEGILRQMIAVVLCGEE